MTSAIVSIDLTKFWQFIENCKKRSYIIWTDLEILRLIFLNPFLYKKFNGIKILKELSKRLKRTEGAIRYKRKLLNNLYPKIISYIIPITESYIFPTDILNSNSKTSQLLNRVWDWELFGTELLEMAKQLPQAPLNPKPKLKLNFDKIAYLMRKRKEWEKEMGYPLY